MTEELKNRPGDQPLPVQNDHTDIQTRLIEDIRKRREVGISRYGTALQPFNGRDMLLDAYEEAMDLVTYLKGVLVERDEGQPFVATADMDEAVRRVQESRYRLCGVCTGAAPSSDGHDKNPPCFMGAVEMLTDLIAKAPRHVPATVMDTPVHELDMVREFNTTYGVPVRTLPTANPDNAALRIEMLREEVKEYEDAVTAGDVVEVADALADILYVAYGGALIHGIPIREVFAEVHRSNMTKLGDDGKPVLLPNGKVTKGPNYEPPKIGSILFGSGIRDEPVAPQVDQARERLIAKDLEDLRDKVLTQPASLRVVPVPPTHDLVVTREIERNSSGFVGRCTCGESFGWAATDLSYLLIGRWDTHFLTLTPPLPASFITQATEDERSFRETITQMRADPTVPTTRETIAVHPSSPLASSFVTPPAQGDVRATDTAQNDGSVVQDPTDPETTPSDGLKTEHLCSECWRMGRETVVPQGQNDCGRHKYIPVTRRVGSVGTMLGPDEIERRMGYHPATDETAPKFENNRTNAITLANIWDRDLPEGREKALALTTLQEALMWANAAVACHSKNGS